MFTGIIQALGRVVSIQPQPAGKRLVVDPGDWNCQPQPGDSIAVNGVCLTYAPADGESAAGASGGAMAFDVIGQTLHQSTLGQLKPGDMVNLESSLTPSTPMGGHFVQGHVDGVGEMVDVVTDPEQWRITVKVPVALMPAIVPRGSVAIEGISLTLAEVDAAAHRFTVALIPTTLKLTTLADAKPGRKVNIETDMIARTVVHWLSLQTEAGPPSLTLDALRNAGFV